MKRSRFTEAQVIGILKEAEAGTKTADLARKHAIKEADGGRVLMSERGQWKDFARDTLRDRRSIGDGDDDVALLVSLLDVPVGFGDPLQRVSPVDHRLQPPRLGELPEPDEIVAAKTR